MSALGQKLTNAGATGLSAKCQQETSSRWPYFLRPTSAATGFAKCTRGGVNLCGLKLETGQACKAESEAIMMRTLAMAVTATMAITFSPAILKASAGAAEVKLLSAAVMKPALSDLVGGFERTTGHKLSISSESAGVVRNRVLA